MNQIFSICLVFMLLLVGCLGDDEKSSVEELLYEGDDPGECSDEADNDKDGLFDCEDDQCAGSPACKDKEITEESKENTEGGEQKDTENKDAYESDYGTGWNEGDFVYNINFTDKDDNSFELYDTSTDLILFYILAEWDSFMPSAIPHLELLQFYSEPEDGFSGAFNNITTIVYLLENENGEESSLQDAKEHYFDWPSYSNYNNTHIVWNTEFVSNLGDEIEYWFWLNSAFPNYMLLEKNTESKWIVDEVRNPGGQQDTRFTEYVYSRGTGMPTANLTDECDGGIWTEVGCEPYLDFPISCHIHVNLYHENSSMKFNEIKRAFDVNNEEHMNSIPEWCLSNYYISEKDFINVTGLDKFQTNHTLKVSNYPKDMRLLHNGLWMETWSYHEGFIEGPWFALNYSGQNVHFIIGSQDDNDCETLTYRNNDGDFSQRNNRTLVSMDNGFCALTGIGTNTYSSTDNGFFYCGINGSMDIDDPDYIEGSPVGFCERYHITTWEYKNPTSGESINTYEILFVSYYDLSGYNVYI